MTQTLADPGTSLAPSPRSVAYDPDAAMQGKLRPALLLSLSLFSLLGLSAAFVPIGGAVIGSGQLGAESRVKHVAHPIGGTVADILVRNGQHVRKGQILVRLDDRVSGAEATFSTLSAEQLLAQKARLEAEQTGAASIIFPAILTGNRSPSAQEAMADERRLFALRRTEQAGLATQLRARIFQSEQEIAGFRAQIESLNGQSKLLAVERDGVRSLYERKLVSIARYNQLERQAVDIGGSIASLETQIASTQGHIAEIRQQLVQLGESRRAEAGGQLATVNAQLNQQQSRNIAALDTQDRTSIRAPQNGVVEQLAVSTVGGVIRPAETIMTLVPDADALVVEASISPADVDQVREGQAARIRFSALSGNATKEYRGRVDYVGTNGIVDEQSGRRYIPIRVTLDPMVRNDPSFGQLRPALPAEVFIETGDRSMLSYITKPLRDQFARSFRGD